MTRRALRKSGHHLTPGNAEIVYRSPAELEPVNEFLNPVIVLAGVRVRGVLGDSALSGFVPDVQEQRCPFHEAFQSTQGAQVNLWAKLPPLRDRNPKFLKIFAKFRAIMTSMLTLVKVAL